MVPLIHYISTSDQCWYVRIILPEKESKYLMVQLINYTNLPEKESQYLMVQMINYISTSDQCWYVKIILPEKESLIA